VPVKCAAYSRCIVPCGGHRCHLSDTEEGEDAGKKEVESRAGEKNDARYGGQRESDRKGAEGTSAPLASRWIRGELQAGKTGPRRVAGASRCR
jgi:hypothetical protein